MRLGRTASNSQGRSWPVVGLKTLLWVAVVCLAMVLGACDDDDGDGDGDQPLDPDTAPRASIDRFSEEAGTLFVRDGTMGLPGEDEPIDFDDAPFITLGLGPAGAPVTYYNFDVQPAEPAPIYVLIREGETQPVPDQLNIVGVIPGDDGYSDFWQVSEVTVPADYVANTVTSVEEIQNKGYQIETTDTVVNCPIVPEGSTAELRYTTEDAGLTMGWYQDMVVFYFNFSEADLTVDEQGLVPLSAIYVAFNVNPGENGGGPESGFMTEEGTDQTHNVLATLPGDSGYSPLWEVNVYDNAAFDMVMDLTTAMDATLLAESTATVNCPVVQVGGAPVDEASIQASDQTLDDLSTVVVTDGATSLGPGWVVIHEDDNGSPGAVIGHAAVSDGENQNIEVTLERPAVDGETLHAMLHVDEGTVGTYEFPGDDVPATDSNNDVVVAPFVVTVPAGTPAIRITMNNVGTTDYEFVSAEPQAYAADVGAGSQDPDITLFLDWRYEIVNQASAGHPFEIIMAGASPAQDTVVLSQSANGTLEGDAGIDWFDDGDTTIRFTATTSLSGASDAYRCATHTTEMRGGITYQ